MSHVEPHLFLPRYRSEMRRAVAVAPIADDTSYTGSTKSAFHIGENETNRFTAMTAPHAVESECHQSSHGYAAISPSMVSGGDGLEPTATSTVLSYWHSRDGTEMLACIIFFVVCSFVPLMSSTNQRPIPYQLLATGDYVRNLSFNEIFQGDTVSDGLLVILGMIVPFLLQYSASTLYIGRATPHATICVYFVAFGINFVCTDLVKSYCGYFRPVFYDLCNPVDGSYTACTNASAEQGARRSFPSGHASMSFCGLTLLTLFLHSRFGVPSLRDVEQRNVPRVDVERDATATLDHGNTEVTKDPFRYRCLSILSLIPMGLALFIAASRVVDNRHFPADVVGGSLLGASIANFVHSLWF